MPVKNVVNRTDAVKSVRLDSLVQSIINQKKSSARLLRRKLRIKKAPKAISIKSQQRTYLSEIMPILRAMELAVKEYVIPQIKDIIQNSKSLRPTSDSAARADDFSDDIEQAMSAARIQFKRKYTEREISFFAEKAADRMQSFNRKEFAKQFSAVLGIDLTSIEPWLPTEIKAFTRENVSLIKSIPDQYFDKVEQSVIRNVRAGALQSDIEEEIKHIYDVSESRAALIARDQTAKFNGTLTQLRQQSVGVKKYQWSTSLDERVRPSHAEKEGNIYSWDSPPSDTGHPGEDFQCRCAALPIFDDEEE